MDGERFDQLARAWVSGSRRRILSVLSGVLLAAKPGVVAADRKDRGQKARDQHAKRKSQDKRNKPAGDRNRGTVREACAGAGVACAKDSGCCSGLCQRNGACTRTKKKGKKKNKVLTGNCICADSGTPGAIPTAPTGLKSEVLDTSQIRLSWSDVTGEDGYRVHNGEALVATLGPNVTSYTVSGLGPGTYRCHRIQAFNASGSSPWSSDACASTHNACVPDDGAACAGRQCGNANNNCGTIVSCGACTGGTTCQNGQCVSTCTPNCAGKVCGSDGCSGTCGTCTSGKTCQNGQCISTCVPNCSGKVCGSDGCSGSCGTCTAGKVCQNGQCISTCVPNCSGKVCGSDGCNGSCGTCTGGKSCQNGQCIAPPGKPSGVQAEALDANRIRVTWNDVSGENGYYLHNGDALVATLGSNVTSYTVTGLAPNTYKCHFVQAYNAAGTSEWSDPACTSTRSLCSQHSQCSSSDICKTGFCSSGQCTETPITCRLRTFVMVPSDVHSLPSDATIRSRTNTMLAQISQYYATKAGLSIRYDPAEVIHAPYDSQWFARPPSRESPGADSLDIAPPVEEPWAPGGTAHRGPGQAEAGLLGIEWVPLWTYMIEAGYGYCIPGWTTLVLTASSLAAGVGGGAVGGTHCKPVLRLSPNSGPEDGPGASGVSMVGQWVLDVVLTGQDSINCKNEIGPNGPYCPVNAGLGTIAHELGHALGLPHPCDDWYRDNWQYSPQTCDSLIMVNHTAYPNVGFSNNERAILQLNPTLTSGAARTAPERNSESAGGRDDSEKRRKDARSESRKRGRKRNTSNSRRRDDKGRDRPHRR